MIKIWSQSNQKYFDGVLTDEGLICPECESKCVIVVKPMITQFWICAKCNYESGALSKW